MISKEEILKKIENAISIIQNDLLYAVEVDLQNNTYLTLLSNLEALDIFLPSEGPYDELNDRIQELIAEDYRQMRHEFGNISYIQKALTKEKQVECEYIVVKETNTWRRDLFLATEYRENIPIKAVWIHKEIDALKAKQLRETKAIIEAQDMAETANKARNEFLKRMKQDIRTPMNTIVGMTAVASANVTNPERVQMCLDTIASTAKEMFSTFKNIMHMLNIEAGSVRLELKPFLLKNLINESMELVFEEAKSRRHMTSVDFSNIKETALLGDAGRLQQVLVEILRNAILYTPIGGTIRVVATEVEENFVGKPAAKTIGETGKTKCFKIQVIDDGVGVSEEFQKIIFEPYARENMRDIEYTHGTGLGLFIARNIIRMMDGDIAISSSKGKGTTVTVSFRCQVAEHVKPEELTKKTMPQETTMSFGGVHVLLVDEDPVSSEIVDKILTTQGIVVDRALNGIEAVQKIEASEEDYYNIVFMDIAMRKMDGFEATTAIRNLQREDVKTLPIIAVSKSVMPEDRVHALMADMDDYFQKSMDYSQYIHMLEKYL